MPYKALDIAAWFVAWADSDDESHLTNLKLQKLLYYAQGATYAFRGEPLFDDDIQAWAHGPVVPEVYHRYKAFGAGPVEPEGSFDWDSIDLDHAKVLARVWNTYGAKSAWKLREMTHQESPWLEHFRDGVSNVVIPKESIAVFFKRNLAS
jgi:uncharacterized phage-associated protein